MKWIDYREKLGIGFNDEQKFKTLSTILQNYVDNVVENSYDENSYLNYCQMVGETYWSHSRPYQHLRESFKRCRIMEELIAHYIAFYNTYQPLYGGYSYSNISRIEVIDYLRDSLDKVNIKYEILEDDEGVFIFPKGAKELDDALVSEPLEWLKDYPNAQKTYIIALKQYTDGIYIRDVADNLRKMLEEFLREFLGNNNDLNKNKKEVETYLKAQNTDSHFITLFGALINHYYLLNNEVAKHNDKMDKKYLEYLLYQTGVFVRMLIVVRMEEPKNAD